MGKIIINECNPFFEMEGKEGDVLYNFRGNNGIKKGSMLYGKTINLSEMYDNMLEYVKEFLFGGEFVSIIDTGKCNISISQLVNKYTVKRYGISMENVYNKIHGNSTDTKISSDIIFNELKVKYGIMGIDWMYLYNNMKIFANDVDILEYIANKIIRNDFYGYFSREYNMRTSGVVKKVTYRTKSNVTYIKVEWNNGSRDICLSRFVRSYEQWWDYITIQKGKKRYDIRDYDVLLNGRNVTDVFPVYCPVFSNLRLNYTAIDFDNGKNNIKKCSEIAGYSDKGETWSFASIDRIDSNKGYSYDNIRIISQYANNLKHLGNIDQMRRLVRYMDEQNSYF
jgi:hypothetical protein